MQTRAAKPVTRMNRSILDSRLWYQDGPIRPYRSVSGPRHGSNERPLEVEQPVLVEYELRTSIPQLHLYQGHHALDYTQLVFGYLEVKGSWGLLSLSDPHLCLARSSKALHEGMLSKSDRSLNTI